MGQVCEDVRVRLRLRRAFGSPAVPLVGLCHMTNRMMCPLVSCVPVKDRMWFSSPAMQESSGVVELDTSSTQRKKEACNPRGVPTLPTPHGSAGECQDGAGGICTGVSGKE